MTRKGKNGGVEYIPEVTYIPKKTGIDAFTQVENDELFNFDREVEPIVQVLVSKTIEQAMLEVQEEDELMDMYKFKANQLRLISEKEISDLSDVVNVESAKYTRLDSYIKDLEGTNYRQLQLA